MIAWVRKTDPALVLLFAALVFVRLVVAVSRSDMHWPDEHFQTLEPAYGIVFGEWFKAWEWNEAFRSWIPPLVYVPVFFGMKLFGVTGGIALVTAARVVGVLISLLIPLGLNRLAVQSGWSLQARVAMGVAFLANVGMALWAPAPLTDSLATALLWGLFPLAWDALQARKGYAAGVLVALPFLIRPHFGIFALVFGVMVVAHSFSRALWWRVLAGGVTVGAIYGAVDWITWGYPFQSLINQFAKGIETSKFYGVEPWSNYFPRLVEDQGLGWVVLATVAFLVGIVYRAKSGGRLAIKSAASWIAIGAAVFFLVHLVLPHKETRFIQPVFPVFFLALGYGVNAFSKAFESSDWRPWARALTLLAAFAGLIGGLGRPLYLTPVNLTPIFDRIYREEKRDAASYGGCIMLVDYNWSWSRGSLGIGRKYSGEDRTMNELTAEDLLKCRWVVAKEDQISRLIELVPPGSREFDPVEKQKNGFVLLR